LSPSAKRVDFFAAAVDGMLPAALLVIEALVVLLVVPAVAHDHSDVALQSALAATLAVCLILAASRARHRLGRVAGSVLQPFLLATGLIAWPMWILGAMFVGLWVAALRVDAEVNRGPGGSQVNRSPDGD
jgi:hypothetical protein